MEKWGRDPGMQVIYKAENGSHMTTSNETGNSNLQFKGNEFFQTPGKTKKHILSCSLHTGTQAYGHLCFHHVTLINTPTL
jgi:hypothetical protein